MAAPRVMVLLLCIAALCLGLSTSAGSAHGSALPLVFSAPASESMSFDVGHDAWISSDTTGANYGYDKELWVGLVNPSAKTYEYRTLLWFDISALPADAIVDAAALELTQTAAEGEKTLRIWPYQITGGWDEYTVTWNSRPSSASAGDPATTVDMTSGLKQWDVSKIVQGWRAGAKINGILLTGDGTTVGTRVFGSRESESGPGRLTIYYHKPAADTATPTATRTRTPTPTATRTPTASPTASPTTTAAPGFGLVVQPSTVDLDIDPLVAGGVDTVETSARVMVSRLTGPGSPVSLSIDSNPFSWLSYTFTPAGDSPSFTSRLVLTASRSALPGPGLYPLTIRGTSGTATVTTGLTLRVLRTLYGDLSVTGAEAVQVVESRAVAAPLIRDKATAFKVRVTSTFPSALERVYFRLTLPATEWNPLNYPEVWGPYKVNPGENSLWLPYVADRRALVDLTTNPAGVIAGQCRGGPWWQCAIDTRHAPRPIAPTVHFTVAADPANTVIEFNEGNNSYSEPGWPAVSTRPWRFYFIPTKLNGVLPRRDEVGLGAKYMMEYLVANFPIADTKVSYSVSYDEDTPAANEARGVTLNRILTLARSEGYDYAVNATTGCGGGGALNGVYATQLGGICPWEGPAVLAHEFNHSTTNTDDTYSLDTLVSWDENYCEYRDGAGTLQRRYCAWSNTPPRERPGAASPYCTQASRDVFPTCSGTITKQVLVDCHCSRAYADGGWRCQETPQLWTTKDECRDSCQAACDLRGGTMYGAPDGRTEHPGGPGMWVNNWMPISMEINSFMDSHWTSKFPYWWQTLLGRYQHTTSSVLADGWLNLINSAAFRRATDPEALLVSGSVTAEGTAAFQPFLRLPEALLDLEPGSKGVYELRLVDAGGKQLSTAGFDLSFVQTDPFGGPVNEAYFVYRIEWVAGTQAIELWSGGKQLARQIVSANAPKLALDSPQGGSHRSSVHVSWTALDDDGDALTFALSVSPDGGATWDPVSLNITGDSYELSLANMPSGSNYQLKLRATDGVNTTQVISQPFTVEAQEQVYLPLVRR